jgi:hypothetical protein
MPGQKGGSGFRDRHKPTILAGSGAPQTEAFRTVEVVWQSRCTHVSIMM